MITLDQFSTSILSRRSTKKVAACPEREEVRIASPFVGSGFILGPYQRRLLNLHHLLRVPPTTRAPSFPLLHPRELPRHVLVSLDLLLLLVHQEALHPSSATNESLFIHDLRGPRLLDLSRRDSGIYLVNDYITRGY